MAKFAVGDQVYIAASRLGIGEDSPFAVVDAKVEAHVGRTLTVSSHKLTAPVDVASSFAQPKLGVLVIAIGDYDTEATLLVPLANAVRASLGLLLPDDAHRHFFIRTREELRVIWPRNEALFGHVIVIAHGRGDAIRFGRSDWASAEDFATMVTAENKKDFVMLACRAGRRDFAKLFSCVSSVRAVVAPLNDTHGAEAAHLCGSLLTLHFLHGRTMKIAFNQLVAGKSLADTWRYWQDGSISLGA